MAPAGIVNGAGISASDNGDGSVTDLSWPARRRRLGIPSYVAAGISSDQSADAVIDG